MHKKVRGMAFVSDFILASMLILFLTGCAGHPMHSKMLEGFVPHKFQSDQYSPKINNFVVILDASTSMGHVIDGRSKLMIAKTFIEKMAETIPELNFNAGLRTSGQSPLISLKNTDLLYGMTAFNTDKFNAALQTVKWSGGDSPLAEALKAVGEDLSAVQGDTPLILVSDGKADYSLSCQAVRQLKKEYGDRLCIYPVIVGNDSAGTKLMNELTWIGDCGFLSNVNELDTSDQLADFVKKIFLTRTKYPDTDGDGVEDRFDKCPGTPQGAVVDSRGCWVIRNVEYAFDKYHLKKRYYPQLDKVVEVLKKNPSLKIEIQGYTDNIGTPAYNQALSEKRAQSVKNYLVKKGIAQDRLYTVGYGATRPIVPNDTPGARAENRRVELQPIYVRKLQH